MLGPSDASLHLANPQNAIFELWQKHDRLIEAVIDRYHCLDPAVSREDLKQQSFIAFVEGLANYDFTKGAHCQLSSYIYRFLQKEFHRLVPGRDKIVLVEDPSGTFLKFIEYSTYEKRKREFQQLGYRTTILSRIERFQETSFQDARDEAGEDFQDLPGSQDGLHDDVHAMDVSSLDVGDSIPACMDAMLSERFSEDQPAR